MMEERQNIIRLTEEAKVKNADAKEAGLDQKPIVIDDPLEWATDLPQPEFKCFNCR